MKITEDLLATVKLSSYIIVSISIGWIAFRFDDLINVLSVIANK